MEDKEGRGKKRLISNFALTAGSQYTRAKKKKKSGQAAKICYYVKVTIRPKNTSLPKYKKMHERKNVS